MAGNCWTRKERRGANLDLGQISALGGTEKPILTRNLWIVALPSLHGGDGVHRPNPSWNIGGG
eukprot:12444351-Ditylum_brightwellii.AAC.1